MTVILDADFYDNEILRLANEKGVFGVALHGAKDLQLQLAFIRGSIEEWYRLIDLSPEPVPDAQGKPTDHVVLTKIFLLTEKGWKRKRQLTFKFPPQPVVSTNQIEKPN